MQAKHFDPELDKQEEKAIHHENRERLSQALREAANKSVEATTPVSQMIEAIGQAGLRKVERIMNQASELHAAYNRVSDEMIEVHKKIAEAKISGSSRWERAHPRDQQAIVDQVNSEIDALNRRFEGLETRLNKIRPIYEDALSLREAMIETIRHRVPGGHELDYIRQTLGWR